MNLSRSLSALLIAGLFASVGAAQSAVPSPPSSSFNYLNLNRGGSNPAVNYYGIVRPNFANQNAIQTLSNNYNSITESSTNGDPNSIRQTGNAASFMNYGHYYPRLNQGGGGGARGGAPGRR